MRIKHLLLVLLVTLLPITPALGENGGISPIIRVSPAKFFETVKPGVSQEYKVRLRNLGSDALPLAASITDIDDISEEGVPIFAESVAKRSAASWLKLSQNDVIVAAGETKEITFTVSPPSSTPPGGYTAAIIFQAQLPSYYFDLDASARILPAISVLAFFTVAGAGEINVEQLSLENLRVPPVVVSSPLSVVADVKNASSFFVQTDAVAEIKNLFGGKTTTEKLGTVILLPEKNRKFVTAFESKLVPGVYTASINFKQGDKVLVGSVKFVSLPWTFILALVGLALAGMVFAGRRRFKRAWAVLQGRDSQPPRARRPTLR